MSTRKIRKVFIFKYTDVNRYFIPEFLELQKQIKLKKRNQKKLLIQKRHK